MIQNCKRNIGTMTKTKVEIRPLDLIQEKIRILYDDRKNHKEFSKLTSKEKREVLDAIDVTDSATWIAIAIAEVIEKRKGN